MKLHQRFTDGSPETEKEVFAKAHAYSNGEIAINLHPTAIIGDHSYHQAVMSIEEAMAMISNLSASVEQALRYRADAK